MKKHSDGSLDWDEYFQRVRREHAAAEAKQLPCPQHIIELSQHDPLTRAYVVSWRDGAVTWEQMLIGLVTAQAAQLERFRALAVSSTSTRHYRRPSRTPPRPQWPGPPHTPGAEP